MLPAEPTATSSSSAPTESQTNDAQQRPHNNRGRFGDLALRADDRDTVCIHATIVSEGVSDELRNLALRKLFRSSVFNIRDGLDEYDDDFTQFEKLGDIVTSDMKHQMEVQEQKLREKLAAEAEAEQQEEDDEDP